jgi:hypothetical protein
MMKKMMQEQAEFRETFRNASGVTGIVVFTPAWSAAA